jgi:hypothetical protein
LVGEKLYFGGFVRSRSHVSPSWEAEAEFDFGDHRGKVEFKDVFVFLSRTGVERLSLRWGMKSGLLRHSQSSSKSLTLVERGFVGIDDFGSLDRVLGARVDGRDSTERLRLAASLGLASHEPDSSQMEFDSPLNAGDDANRGWSLSGRVELQPLGEVDYDQGDFGSESLRFAVAAAAYRWSTTGQEHYTESGRNGRTSPTWIDAGRGASSAVRAGAYGRRRASMGPGDDGPHFDGGLYSQGEADLAFSVQSGYMVFPKGSRS